MTNKRKIYAIALIFAGVVLYALPRLLGVPEAGMLAGAAAFLCMLFAMMLFLKKEN